MFMFMLCYVSMYVCINTHTHTCTYVYTNTYLCIHIYFLNMVGVARESFVITTGTAGTKAGAAPKAPVEDVRSLGIQR